ncbi:Ankyrin-1 [Fusarium odoratissimum]|uniref:Ankyrin-1 n=1 Tax=Fusarium oxysporum f. sp. cubense (strain race 4) TaxID=2502994 RepID=N1RMY5_FUSC4|nr:Ankyrin-1 [Fusarium odoratissimum]
MTDPWSDDQADEPLLAFDPPMEDQVIGEDDTFRTQNASLSDWERRNIIERTSGSIHTRVELLSVSHGSYNEGGDEATLLVFRFRFDPQKSSRRVLWAKAEIEFFAEDALDLTVEAIAPEERWAVVPTTDTETTTRSGQLNLGAPAKDFAVIMAEPVIPNGQKPVLEVRTTIDNEEDNKEPNNTALKVIQEGGHLVTTDENSDNEGPFVPFDVILIHGIYGTSLDSWTRGSNTIWINKAFADVSARMGRIMSYGYHTDVEKGRYYSPYGIYQEAEALLEALRELRTPEIKEARRPIYLFSHDIGGTIVKAALSMATDREDKYADILHYTRAMSVLRLLDQKRQLWSGNMVWYAKCLTKTIVKVNDAFLGTQMLTQANFVNVVSNLHLEPSQQIFPLSMSTMATPFERVVKMEKPNCDLILAGEDGSHPVNDVSYSDWLMGDLNDEQRVALRKVINQASPVLPYLQADEDWQHPDLLDLPERTETIIVHMRCSSGAEAETENASFFLNNRSGTYHPLLYMKFDAHDIRFNTCEAMLRTFIARISCNRLQTESTVSRTMDTLITFEALHRVTLFNEAERLQSIEEYVRTINYHPKEPIPFPVDMEASKLMKELDETERHEMVLRTCIDYIQDAAENPDDATLHLPYAIEFWPKHWQLVEASEMQVVDLFENDTVFEFWANSLVGLKNTLLKPPPKHIKPLPVAAHLGLTTVAETLLRRSPDQPESRDQALIEACRAGHVAVIRLLVRSYSDGLDFGDENLHEAARVAGNSYNSEALREIVNGLPEPPKTASVQESTRHEFEANSKPTKSQEKNDQQDNSSDGAMKGEQEVKDTKSEKHVSGPLDWLVMPMNRAVKSGMDDVVTRLLQLGVDPTPPKGITPYGNSFIYTAANTSNISCAKLLIEAGANPAARNDQGYTPLHTAIDWASGETVEFLLEHGASIEDEDPENRRALDMAASWGSFTALEIILQQKDLTPENANTPLILAISMGDLGMVKLLIEHGATIDKREAPPDEGWSRTPHIVQYLLEKGADPNARDSDDIPVIGAAVDGGHTNMVKWLVEASAEVNVTYFEAKSTPLHEATAYPEMVRLLLQHGADISKVNAYSRTALNYAICANSLAAVQIMLEETKAKSDLGAANIEPDLRAAVSSGWTEVVEALLEAGADVNAVDEENKSLLACAMTKGASIDMIRKVLEYNPDLELKDNKQNTALHCINTSTSLDTVRLVVNAGGKLNVLNFENETPLIYAIRAQLDDVFSYMLRKEPALLNGSVALSKQSVTPLHEACRAGTLAMVRSLIEHQVEVNSTCKDVYGTPLIAATLRSDVVSSGLASEIIALLLLNGADPKVSAGLFRYPLISACLACPTETIKLLLNSDASPLDQDSLTRKPVHLSCYNSLEVLNLLEIPDSDFSARDIVGRVPLHYAVMRGDVELVQAVLERSKRAGIDIDVKDDDGWTPLLWAFRASPIWNHQLVDPVSTLQVVSLLVKNGADINAKGHGSGKDWTFRDVAYYHHAESIDMLLDQKSAASEGNTPAKKRGSLPVPPGDESWFCHCCLLESHGIYFKCSACHDFTLCYKCHWSSSKTHPDHSSYIRHGSEWYDGSTSDQEKISEMGIDDGGRDEDVLLDREEILYEDFDSAMSDETSEH